MHCCNIKTSGSVLVPAWTCHEYPIIAVPMENAVLGQHPSLCFHVVVVCAFRVETRRWVLEDALMYVARSTWVTLRV